MHLAATIVTKQTCQRYAKEPTAIHSNAFLNFYFDIPRSQGPLLYDTKKIWIIFMKKYGEMYKILYIDAVLN